MVEKTNSSTLILGFGAQRCGTTWLGEHLKTHPDILMSPIKELRFFVGEENDPDWYARHWAKNKQRTLAAGYDLEKDYDDRIAMGVSSAGHIDLYKQFFADRLSGQRYHCEITPAYMTLPRGELLKIKESFENLKIIFLMRDPIARLWSMIHFNHKNRRDNYIHHFAQTCLENPNYKTRCDYKAALQNLDSVFDPDQIFVGFYEDMFTGDMLAQLYRFLDIPEISADTQKRANTTKPSLLPEDIAEYFAENLMEQYDYIRDRFGNRVPEGWLL